jgi:hypothetical protein
MQINYLEFDDHGFLLPGMDMLLRLKKVQPDLKITAFTIPLPIQFFHPQNKDHFKVEKYKKWAELMNSYDWIEIAMHGFFHVRNEFDKPYWEVKEMLEAAENMWDKIGLNYKKIFRAPYWEYSHEALYALRDKGYTVCINRNNPRTIPEGLKVYIFNWSFEEDIPKVDVIKGHGHAFPTGKVSNSLDQTFPNLAKLTGEFKFVSEYEKNDKDYIQKFAEANIKSGEDRTSADRSSADRQSGGRGGHSKKGKRNH